MLDYYFCEECQTYHQPNRFINGEILSACECQISTQPSGLDQLSQSHGQQTNKKQIYANRIISNSMQNYPPTQVHFNYQNPKAITNPIQVVHQQSPSLKYQNIPYRNIIQQEKVRPIIKNIVKNPQITSQQFLSPRTVRQMVPIKKSLSPPLQKAVSPTVIRNQRIISPVNHKSIVNVMKKPQPTIKTMRQIPVQKMSQKIIPIKTPIQTVRALPSLVMVPQSQIITARNLNRIPYEIPIEHSQNIQQNITSLANIGPPQILTEIPQQVPKSDTRMQSAVVLDRVSYSQQQIQIKQQKPAVVLDRISISHIPGVIQQKQEQDAQCCGKFCYH